jgi:hypothetical protein
MTKPSYLNDAEKVSKAMEGGRIIYFSGNSLGDTAILGNDKNVYAVKMEDLKQFAGQNKERTIGSAVGFNEALMIPSYGNKAMSSYASQITQPGKPEPLKRPRNFPLD